MNNAKISLQHLAIIPDGNRRWAKTHGIVGEHGVYEKGSEKIFEIVEAAFESGVEYVTFWASSYSNLLERPKAFVGALEDMYVKRFRELASHPYIHKHQIKVVALGEWREILRPDTVIAIDEALESTKNYSGKKLVILVGYDGVRERGRALQKMLATQQDIPADITGAALMLRMHAVTGHLPDVDLVIRTGAWQDPHNSAGFLGFLTADSQLAFPSVLWPDFTAENLRAILTDFHDRERRLGR